MKTPPVTMVAIPPIADSGSPVWSPWSCSSSLDPYPFSHHRCYNLKDDLNFNFKTLITASDRKRGPITHRSHILVDTYFLPPFHELFEEAQRSLTIENAGGRSDISEMYSIDYWIRNYGATNLIFETEVEYWIRYKMVDFICTIESARVGVSVARAMGYPDPDRFTAKMAARLLYKKLYGLIVARNAVSASQSFYKSILHIWCQTAQIAELLEAAFANLDADDYGLDVKGIVILQLTISPDSQLYTNRLQ